jgi:tRNA(fMet)-specific endonuclease VapC
VIVFDTDVCIELLRGNRRILARRQDSGDEVAVSFMTVGELFYGAARSSAPDRNRMLVELFLVSVRVLDSDLRVMRRFGELKAQLVALGATVPDADLLIAAVCLTHQATLATGNVRHFKRLDVLQVEDWLAS